MNGTTRHCVTCDEYRDECVRTVSESGRERQREIDARCTWGNQVPKYRYNFPTLRIPGLVMLLPQLFQAVICGAGSLAEPLADHVPYLPRWLVLRRYSHMYLLPRLIKYRNQSSISIVIVIVLIILSINNNIIIITIIATRER